MPSDDKLKDPIESASKGLAKGALEWTSDRLQILIKKFKEKDLAFIKERETIETAKEQREKAEWYQFKTNIKDKDLRILFMMGLTLRAHEKKGKDMNDLKSKILKKYKMRGLHIALFVQNGLFGKYIGSVIEKVSSQEGLKEEIENLFNNIENTVAFVNAQDNVAQKSKEIVTKILAHSPHTYIISSAESAITVCEQIKKKVMENISSSYGCEIYSEESEKGKKIYFIKRKNIV